MRNHGFTLIELLVASVVALLVLGLVASGIQSGSSATSVIQTQQQLGDDVRIAGNYIADSLASAVYVFPAGTALTVGPSGYTTKNPATNNNTWVVGTHPIIAAITPPRDTNQWCPTTSSNGELAGCYQFKAYYALRRGDVVAAATGADNPGADPSNNNQWVIYEYRENLQPGTGAFTTWNPLYEQDNIKPTYLYPLPEVPQGLLGTLTRVYTNNKGGGNLLADFIQPNAGFSLDFATDQCSTVDAKFNIIRDGEPNPTCTKTFTTDPDRTYSLSRITLTIVGQKLGRQNTSTPSLNFVLSPRNLAAFLKN